jgi:putative spermidine/putrescine transport system permease protein
MSGAGAGRGLLAALLVASPVLVGVGYSLLGALDVAGVGTAGELGLERVRRVLAEPVVWRATAWSAWIAGAATLLATLAAMLLALVFRADRRLDRTARALAVLPLPIPHVVAAVVGLLILGQSGLLARVGHALGLVEAPAAMPALVFDPLGVGLVLSLAWKELPFLALIAFSVLAGQAAALDEAARTLGAGRWATARRVTLPLLWRGMMPAVAAVFVFAFGSYEAAVLLAPSDPLPLPLLLMERYTDPALARRADAFVLALLALAVSALAVALHEHLRARGERVRG